MRLVVEANVIISALIADSKTRELIVTLEPNLPTPEVIHDEIEDYEALIIEKSGMDADRVQQFDRRFKGTQPLITHNVW